MKKNSQNNWAFINGPTVMIKKLSMSSCSIFVYFHWVHLLLATLGEKTNHRLWYKENTNVGWRYEGTSYFLCTYYHQCNQLKQAWWFPLYTVFTDEYLDILLFWKKFGLLDICAISIFINNYDVFNNKIKLKSVE